ncbi:hypothetical protein ACFQ4C_10605 [Larkinella insperata]|uniref:TspO/MBR related protein n=1 Tax=Larkinella insperata TaxID=332158 RepID=A0ABW3Q8C4_9BACT|nr:hypothetical protein [Larkinella insperata]
MNNRLLGALAMLGAPCLGLSMIRALILNDNFESDLFGGVLSVLYMAGWLCSMVGLWNIRATGDSRFGRASLGVIFGSLTLANVWNVYDALVPNANTFLYRALDLNWPLSNLMMLVIGIAVIRARRLTGWNRYIPLVVGLWLPFSILVSIPGGGAQGTWAGSLSAVYSIITWTLLAYVVYTSQPELSLVPSQQDTDEIR